jgi:hypothetical protein
MLSLRWTVRSGLAQTTKEPQSYYSLTVGITVILLAYGSLDTPAPFWLREPVAIAGEKATGAVDRERKLEQLLTVKQAAKLLSVGRQKLLRLGIPVIEFGPRCKRYDPADIRAWMAKYKVDPDAVRAPNWRERKRQLEAEQRAAAPWIGIIDRLTSGEDIKDAKKRAEYQRRSASAKAAWERRWEKQRRERGIT